MASPWRVVVLVVLLAAVGGALVRSARQPQIDTLADEIDLAADNTATLPLRWEYALDAFDKGTILPAYFGEKYHSVFSTCRREECDRIHAEIPDRDYEWYLRAV